MSAIQFGSIFQVAVRGSEGHKRQGSGLPMNAARVEAEFARVLLNDYRAVAFDNGNESPKAATFWQDNALYLLVDDSFGAHATDYRTQANGNEPDELPDELEVSQKNFVRRMAREGLLKKVRAAIVSIARQDEGRTSPCGSGFKYTLEGSEAPLLTSYLEEAAPRKESNPFRSTPLPAGDRVIENPRHQYPQAEDPAGS